MQDPKEILRLILNTGRREIDELLETEIDVPEVVQEIVENGLDLDYNRLMHDAFWMKLESLFDYDGEKYEGKFDIYCNGIDTHIQILSSIVPEYREKYCDKLDELEDYMNMELEQVPFM